MKASKFSKKWNHLKTKIWRLQFITSLFSSANGRMFDDDSVSRIMHAPFKVPIEKFIADIDLFRQCFYCRRMDLATAFPQHRLCGGCKSVTYCSSYCQKMHWLCVHSKECTGDHRFRVSHRCLDICLRFMTRVAEDESFVQYMQQFRVPSRLCVLTFDETGNLLIYAVEKNFVAYLPIDVHAKQDIIAEISSSARFRLCIGVHIDDELQILSCEL